MLQRVVLSLAITTLVVGCSQESPTIQFEKFMGDRQVNLEPGDTETDSNSDESAEGETLAAGCIDGWISDGWCDIQNNREECGFDGGDCCPSTCEDSMYFCGDYQWICIDPEACETTGECEPAPNNIEMTYEEFCEMYPEFCDDIDDCEQFPELCDP